jgi:hypothetical protein
MDAVSIEGLQRDIVAVKECASDLQALLGSKVIEEEAQKEEEYLMALLSDDEYLQQFNLRYTIISLIDFTDGCCITDIICACTASIVLTTTDGGLVSIDTDPNVVIVDNTSCIFVLMVYLKLNCCRYSSSEDGTLDKEIFCSHYPFDVTCLDDTTVAVSTTNGIIIVNIDLEKIERFIKTSKPFIQH